MHLKRKAKKLQQDLNRLKSKKTSKTKPERKQQRNSGKTISTGYRRVEAETDSNNRQRLNDMRVE